MGKEPVKDKKLGMAGEKGRKLGSKVSQKLSEKNVLQFVLVLMTSKLKMKNSLMTFRTSRW